MLVVSVYLPSTLNLTNKTYYTIFDYDVFFAGDSAIKCQNPVFTTSGSYRAYENELAVKFSTTRQGNEGIRRTLTFEQMDGIFISLLLCFLLLVHVYRKGFVSFRENLQLVFSARHNVSMFSESTVREFWYNFLLVLQSVFLFSLVLLIYFLETKTSITPPENLYLTLIDFGLLFLLFEGLKVLFYRFVVYLFDIKGGLSAWLRIYMTIVQVTGILLYIPVLILIYFDCSHSSLFLFFFLLFIASRLVIICRLYVFFFQKNVNPLYLIAYLCSAEIIPYVLLYGGMLYLYENEIINLIWL